MRFAAFASSRVEWFSRISITSTITSKGITCTEEAKMPAPGGAGILQKPADPEVKAVAVSAV